MSKLESDFQEITFIRHNILPMTIIIISVEC